jgi:hypothetical protein
MKQWHPQLLHQGGAAVERVDQGRFWVAGNEQPANALPALHNLLLEPASCVKTSDSLCGVFLHWSSQVTGSL